jgi:sec-independent protein translocase protein TatC
MRNRVTLEKLRRYRGYALVLAFAVSSLIQWRAPPDVISMSIMALSMYLLYELGLLFAGRLLKR